MMTPLIFVLFFMSLIKKNYDYEKASFKIYLISLLTFALMNNRK